jgi:purine-cytosine permease-like protein
MTYFGVNHLLSGLHSYAAGDKVNIPMSIWISVCIVVVITVVSSWNDKRIKS